MKILVTGVAGFIGFHLALALINRGDNVIGIDNLNDYYDPSLKKTRLDEISRHPKSINFKFMKADISERSYIAEIFAEHSFDVVVNLAAQAGVRYSLENPQAFVDSNLVGFVNILESCRHTKIKHLIFASSSSVYGMNVKQPFSINDRVDYPVSFYAATKRSNELIAHTYSHLFNIPTTGLRFFSVYGPYGRPDMAYFKFTKAINNGDPIDVFNEGNMKRDFTYIDDIIFGVLSVMSAIPSPTKPKESNALAPFRLLNIGNNNPITLRRFISAIEKSLNRKAIERNLPMQDGDVPTTFADIDSLYNICKFKPKTSIEDGIQRFVDWYKNSNNV